MKNVEKYVVKERSKEKEGGNVFTKNGSNDIIKEDYNPLKVNCGSVYKRRDVLYNMEKERIEKENKIDFKKLIDMRINENVNLFSKEELLIIKNNQEVVQKLYMLGVLDNI